MQSEAEGFRQIGKAVWPDPLQILSAVKSINVKQQDSLLRHDLEEVVKTASDLQTET